MLRRARRPVTPTVEVVPADKEGRWLIDVVAPDQVGLLAAIAGAFHDCGLEIVTAAITTAENGSLQDSFVVRADDAPDETRLAQVVETMWNESVSWVPVPNATVTFEQGDGTTSCEVRAADRPGLLRDLAAACAAAGASIQAAKISTEIGAACDRFELVDTRGRPLDPAGQRAVRTAITTGR